MEEGLIVTDNARDILEKLRQCNDEIQQLTVLMNSKFARKDAGEKADSAQEKG